MTGASQRFSSFFWRWAFLFFTLYVVTLPFDYYLFSPIFDVISIPFRRLAEFTGNLFFGVNLIGAGKFYSDSLIVYVHLFNIVLISFPASAAWTFFAKQKFTETKLYPLLFTVLRYFVAFNLLVYGFSKLYKWQFMLPEPNLLYTNVGDMHRDILYWTSMGTSRSYSVFMGLVEIIPAILLLFRRTTLPGAFAAVLVMSNVVAVNFGFDITVKLHSMALLLMSIVILTPGRKRMAALFTGKSADEFIYPTLKIFPTRKWILPSIKIAVILLLLAEAHYPYTITGTFNDDTAERPPMHGAYEVIDVHTKSFENDSLTKVDLRDELLKRVFINRRGYIIFEHVNGTMTDMPLTIDTTDHRFLLQRDDVDDLHDWIGYEKVNDSTYTFTDASGRRIYTMRKLTLEKLPLLEEEFTWIDED